MIAIHTHAYLVIELDFAQTPPSVCRCAITSSDAYSMSQDTDGLRNRIWITVLTASGHSFQKAHDTLMYVVRREAGNGREPFKYILAELAKDVPPTFVSNAKHPRSI